MKTGKKYILWAVLCAGAGLVVVNFVIQRHGNYPQFTQYRSLQNVFDACNKNTIVTFDVDNTLIAPADITFRDLEDAHWLNITSFFKHPSLLFDRKKREWFASIILTQAQYILTDSNIPHIIQQLQKQGCLVLALSAVDNGAYGIINNLPIWRAHMLKNFGIDFQANFIDTAFTQFRQTHGSYPCLYRGILFTNHVAKGKILGAFLDHLQIAPERIVSIDNRTGELNTIAHECQKRNIAFWGYQYIGAQQLPGTWNTKRARLQVDTVIRKQRWLSDKQADALLKHEIQAS